MTAFYREVLGLRPIEETRLPDWVEFHGGTRFSLHAIPAAIAAGIAIESPPRPREQGGVKLTFAVEDVEATGLDRRDGPAATTARMGRR